MRQYLRLSERWLNPKRTGRKLRRDSNGMDGPNVMVATTMCSNTQADQAGLSFRDTERSHPAWLAR
jgi:hypothetical protein